MYKNQLIAKFSLACLLLHASSFAWGEPPPNPTASDIKMNTAGGTDTLKNNSGSANTGFGYSSLTKNIFGSFNLAAGSFSLTNNTNGSGNVALGHYALTNNITGSSNTATGHNALLSNITGHDNTAYGFDAMYSSNGGNYNTGLGSAALIFNQTGSENTASGYKAIRFNTTGNRNTANGVWTLSKNESGNENTAIGSYSQHNYKDAHYNTSLGAYALQGTYIYDYSNPVVSSGSFNTASGYKALFINQKGIKNTATGANSLLRNKNGHYNTAIGDSSLLKSEGHGNTALGLQALMNKGAGSYNIALGINSGVNLTSGNYNIYIDNPGAATESSTIRIGDARKQTRTFIAGIRGRKTGSANAVPVVIDSNGQLGTINSSARFKKDIADMNAASAKLMQLRPVTYRYKEADANGTNPLEYGLIAEEVAKVYPDLVAYGADGQIETVQYQKLTPMLLNEVQRTNRLLENEKLKNQQQAEEIAKLKAQIGVLETQAQRIEALTTRLSKIQAQQSVGLLQ